MPSAHSFLMTSLPLTPMLLGQLGDGDRLAHPDDALVLGGRGDLGLLDLLAGGDDPLARRSARALPGLPGAGRPKRSRAGWCAVTQARTAQAPQLLVAVLDLDAWDAGLRLAARRQTGKLDEGTRRRRTGDHRLGDGLENRTGRLGVGLAARGRARRGRPRRDSLGRRSHGGGHRRGGERGGGRDRRHDRGLFDRAGRRWRRRHLGGLG